MKLNLQISLLLLSFFSINLLSYFAYQNTLTKLHHNTLFSFEQASEKYFNALKQTLDTNLDVALSLQAFYYGSQFVSRKEFADFSKVVLKHHPEIWVLNWLPKISDKQRLGYEKNMRSKGFDGFTILEKTDNHQTTRARNKAIYYPIHYIEPFETNKNRLGLDSSSFPEALAAINQINILHKFVISSPLTFIQNNQKNILIFFPIYKEGSLLGLVEAVLCMDDVRDYTRQRFNLDEQALLNLSEIINNEKVFITTENQNRTDKHALFYHEKTLPIANKHWKFEFYPSSSLVNDFEMKKKQAFYSYIQSWPIPSTILFGLLFFLMLQHNKAEKNVKKFKFLHSHFKRLINQTADAYFLHDFDGNILDVNWHSCYMLGYSREELLDMSVVDISSLTLIELKTKWNKFKLGEIKTIEDKYFDKEGHIIPIEVSVNYFILNDKLVFSALARDISERIKTTQALQEARDQALQANLAKSDFLANMSHELRTPMHGILSFARLGVKKIETAEKTKLLKYFNRINQSGERLLVLLNDLLDLAKLEAGHMKMEMDKHHLSQVIESCLAEQESRIKEKKLQVKSDFIDDNVAIFDSARIGQVMTNLLSNAIKFTPNNKSIYITISQQTLNNEQALCLAIEDEGLGIPDNELTEVFDKFIQSSKTTTQSGGTGLGLSICKEIIDLHKGKIWAEKREQGGTMFKFVIPKGMGIL
ncbi:MAG: CHASE domain-containing protein [Methylococcales bacterium]|nr:CHASE domain-containing protein [Methylococcales bacterium]